MTTSLNLRFRSLHLLPIFTLILAVVACECVPVSGLVTFDYCYGNAAPNYDQNTISECIAQVNALCPAPNPENPDAVVDAEICVAAVIYAFYYGGEMPDLPPYETAEDASEPRIIPPQSSCEGLRLTSPLDGMPNGVAAFYWDPLASGHATYDITVMDENHTTLAVFPAANQTSVSGDVSQAAIGGGFQFWVRVTSYSGGHICTDEHLIMRSASDFTQPTPTRRRP